MDVCLQRARRRDRRDAPDDRDSSKQYVRGAAITRENSQLELYYNTLVNLSEEEKAQFWTVLRRELPNSFRFCGSKG
jgi:multisite-specific tRNA:(cytosine-C5)-methyltransferase